MARRRRTLILASLVAASALVAAGCGSTPAATTTAQNGTLASAFAFARCMRAHGIPNWPDPNRGGFFDKTKLRPLGLSVSRVRALEEGPCNIPLPSRNAYTLTPGDRADYVAAAACMRSHGFPDFPDPTFPNNTVEFNIPTSIDGNSARFKSAATTCTKLIPAGLPYSKSTHD